MSRERFRAARLATILLFGIAAFHYPLLEVFSADATLGGMPLLYVYLFGTWLVFILAVARLGRGR